MVTEVAGFSETSVRIYLSTCPHIGKTGVPVHLLWRHNDMCFLLKLSSNIHLALGPMFDPQDTKAFFNSTQL